MSGKRQFKTEVMVPDVHYALEKKDYNDPTKYNQGSKTRRDSGVVSNGWVSDVEYYLCFTATLTSARLSLPPVYSEYQQFLHDTIMGFCEKGWTFKQVAKWFNENGYQTATGKRFYGTHVFSILKKKRLRDGRIRPKHDLEIGPLSIQYVERKLINSI